MTGVKPAAALVGVVAPAVEVTAGAGAGAVGEAPTATADTTSGGKAEMVLPPGPYTAVGPTE